MAKTIKGLTICSLNAALLFNLYLWPQKTPLGRELGAERQNNTEVKNHFL